MMIALPSASNSDNGPSESVTRVVDTFIVPRPLAPTSRLRNVAHVERMVGVGIHVARRTRIEMAPRGGEVRFAFADRVQVHAVHAGLETGHRDGDVDHLAGSLRVLGELARFRKCLRL